MHYRCAIVEDTPAEEPESNSISTFGNTHWISLAFPQLRLAVFRTENASAHRFIHCHVVVYSHVTLPEIISVILSSTAARTHYTDP